jgi:hypothetical protein
MDNFSNRLNENIRVTNNWRMSEDPSILLDYRAISDILIAVENRRLRSSVFLTVLLLIQSPRQRKNYVPEVAEQVELRKVKVKQSRYRPGVVQRVPES